MNKKLITGALGLVLATGITSAALTTSVASADSIDGECQGPRGGEGHEAFRELVDREVEEIDNGVVITLTTKDEDALAHIQERATKDHPNEPDNVDHEVELLDDGIQVTITSDDPDTIERIQQGPQHGPHGHHGEGDDEESERTDGEDN